MASFRGSWMATQPHWQMSSLARWRLRSGTPAYTRRNLIPQGNPDVNPFTILAPPLGQLLSILFNVWPSNYGIAIILLTLIVSLLLFPLTLKQTRSMKAMQEIQPEVKRSRRNSKERPRRAATSR